MSRPFDECLDIVFPCDLRQLSKCLKLGKLRFIVRIGYRARSEPVTQREGDVVGFHDLTDLLEVGIEEILLMVVDHPLRHDGTAATDDPCDTFGGHGYMVQQQSCVDGEVVHPLLRLFDECIAEDLPCQVLGDPVHLLKRLIDRHGPDGYGRVTQYPVTRGMDVLTRAQIHHRIRTPSGGPDHLLHLFGDAGSGRGVTDVGIDLDKEVSPDDHRLHFGVIDVARDDRTSCCDLLTYKLGSDLFGKVCAEVLSFESAFSFGITQITSGHLKILVLPDSDELHLRCDDARSGIVQLRDIFAFFGTQWCTVEPLGACCDKIELLFSAVSVVLRLDDTPLIRFYIPTCLDPLFADGRDPLLYIDLYTWISIRSGGVINTQFRIVA